MDGFLPALPFPMGAAASFAQRALFGDPEAALRQRLLALQVSEIEGRLGLAGAAEYVPLSDVVAAPRVVVLLGAIGSGKSYTATALAAHAVGRGLKLVVAGSGLGLRDAEPWVQRAPRVAEPWEAPDGSVVLADDAGVNLHAERAQLKPTLAFAAWLAELRHHRCVFICLAQSAKQVPMDVLSVDCDTWFGLKRMSFLPSLYTRPELQAVLPRLTAARAQLLRTWRSDPRDLTVWCPPDGALAFSGMDSPAPKGPGAGVPSVFRLGYSR